MPISPDDREPSTDDAKLRGHTPSMRPHEGAQLVVLTGTTAGRRYKLGDRVTIGRSADNTIPITDDAKVSRHHVEIMRDERGYVLRDLGSRNGTIVNRMRVERRRLRYGDEVVLGDRTWFLFTLVDPREEQALERQKMEAVGRLGAGVAHDFNNLLGAVVATLDSLTGLPRVTMLGDQEVLEHLADIRLAVARTTELTQRLLAFSRREVVELDRVDVTALCLDVVQLLRRTLDRQVAVSADVSPSLWVDGHASEIHQAIMNLCMNAADAMPTGGALTVSARLAEPEELPGLSLLVDAPHIVISISDTGVGMDDATRKRVFEPFFTTKEKAAFVGFGLATVFDVATTHGGTIDLASELGAGTTVRLVLPARVNGGGKERRDAATRPSAATLPDRRTGRVLLVDDQPLVRKSWLRLLRRAGHDVVLAENGEEALAQLVAGESFDVVLLDIDMPVLDGVSTLAEIRRTHPDLPVACVSGHWDRPTEKRLRELGVLDVVEKPLGARRLLELVDTALALAGAGDGSDA